MEKGKRKKKTYLRKYYDPNLVLFTPHRIVRTCCEASHGVYLENSWIPSLIHHTHSSYHPAPIIIIRISTVKGS